MKRLIVAGAAAVLLAFASLAFAGPAFAATCDSLPAFARLAMAGGDEAAVLRAEDARFAAMLAGDAGGMRNAFAEDLAYVHSNGIVQGRDALIAAIAGRELRYLALEPMERTVTFLGPDAAYVLGRGRIRVEASGREVDFQGRYLAIYGRTGANWQLRAWQSLRLP